MVCDSGLKRIPINLILSIFIVKHFFKKFQSHCNVVTGAIILITLNIPSAAASDISDRPGSEYENFLNQTANQNVGGPPNPQQLNQFNKGPHIVQAMPVDM